MTAVRRVGWIVALATLVAALAYLRDPPWLGGMTSGMHAWMADEDGTPVRWMDGRASFFVPAESSLVRLPIRTTFDDPADWPITVTVTLDGRPVEQFVLRDATWRVVELRLPPRGTRRHRRIDVHLDRLRAEGKGALLGNPVIR